jgi:prepilin-type N-terminal cleavage/methylation domain-containing protein
MRAFTLIEAMICMAIIAIVVSIGVKGCAVKEMQEARLSLPAVTVEQNLDTQSIIRPAGWLNMQVVVLPTGERVLLTVADGGRMTSVLLPPLPKPQVERPSDVEDTTTKPTKN